MKRTFHSSILGASSVRPIVIVALAFGIFTVDTITDLEIAVAVFYVAVVLMSLNYCQKRGVMLVSAGCMALTLLSHFLTRTGSPQAGLVNCVISLSAIVVTTYLALKIQSAEVAALEARAQITHIARLTALGELTASIAHEVNQPLAAVVISGNACLRWLAGEPPNVEKARQAVDRIVKDANRASDVIRRIRSLATRAPPLTQWLSMNEVILEVVALMRTEIERNHISLRTQLGDDLPRVLGDRIQLQQVILNVIINAIETLSAVGEGPRELVVSSANGKSNDVLVAVRDSGPGLAPGEFDHLFDAFHTTKPDGMGIGLAISRSIIEAHGGRAWASPNDPQGAVFQFTVPIGEKEPT